jgi:hypothetical protein
MKLRLILLFKWLLLGSYLYSQMNVRRVSSSSLPSEISQMPDIGLCVRWTDTTGDNVVVSTMKLNRPSDDRNYFKECVPSVYRFLVKNDTTAPIWATPGSGLSCQIAGKGDKVKSSLLITDLDKNNVAEIWIIFKAICVNDDAPSPMKIVMHQLDRRYQQTGTRLWKNDEATSGGGYQFDDAFQRTAAMFKDYADRLWKQNVTD